MTIPEVPHSFMKLLSYLHEFTLGCTKYQKVIYMNLHLDVQNIKSITSQTQIPTHACDAAA